MGQRSDFSKPCQGAAEKSANATRKALTVSSLCGSQRIGMPKGVGCRSEGQPGLEPKTYSSNDNKRKKERFHAGTLLLCLLSFTPFCKLFVGALDIVAAAHMVIGALVVIDAGSGVVVGLSHTAFFHHRIRQRDGRQQAAGVGVDGILEDLFGRTRLQQVAQMQHADAVRDT